jgi:hypothetical protein
MPTPDRFLSQLKELRVQYALEALSPHKRSQSAYGYGLACGVVQGLEMAERLLNDEITAQEEFENGSKLAAQTGTTSRPRR